MRYKSVEELSQDGFLGTVWLVEVVAFTEWIDDGGVVHEECVYWDDGVGVHPFERLFDDYREARAYAASFDRERAVWAHSHGVGPDYEHIAVDVVQFEFDGDLSDGDVRCIFNWYHAKELEVIEFDENWNQILPEFARHLPKIEDVIR